MKFFAILALTAATAVAGCAPNQGALTGAAIGATAGATLADSDDQIEAAIAGGALGAAVGNAAQPRGTSVRQCRYQRSNGTTYVAPCP